MIYLISLIAYTHAWDALVGTSVSSATQTLHNLMTSYQSKFVMSGQFLYWDELISITSKTPLIQGFDLQNYSPHNPWHSDWSSWDDGTIQRAIDWYKQTKGIVTVHWHWFSPMGGQLQTSTFYTSQTDFNTQNAVIDGTAENKALIRDLDAIAIQLKRLLAQNIPVLWRPLHEAGGAWFWWGRAGSTVCKKLWQIMFKRLDQYHKINNLIWVWSTPEADWYPGKSLVDIIGFDSYPGAFNYDCNLNIFMQLHKIVGGSKLVAISENGPIPDIEKCISSGAHWSYFMSWSDLVVQQNSNSHIKGTYSSSKTKNLN